MSAPTAVAAPAPDRRAGLVNSALRGGRLAGVTSLRVLLAGMAVAAAWTAAGEVPETDVRNTEIRHTDFVHTMPVYSAAEWEQRADYLRKKVMFSSGLLPLPHRGPLHPRLGEWVHHDDHSVASVLLETHPGFYLGGNLYRPRQSGQGKFPAVVSPHGHWRYGRFENSELNSVPSRAINLARQGYVVFAYDMVGWNDTMQVPHGFAGPREDLWLIGTLGLQLWNSIRVVDFLESLPDVDPSRIGVTGASGGATQAFLLAAVDDRIGYSAPVNMVSFHMQGGSPCENAPLLRVGTNNVEISAAFAPKPQILVAATGDWTVNVPTREFPAVRQIYELFDAGSRLEFRQFDSPHNYHRQSREAVYRFFGEHMLGEDGEASKFEERPIRVDQLSSLLYLWGRPLPEGAVGLDELVRQRIAAAEADTLALSIRGPESLEPASKAFRERLALSILAEVPAGESVEGRSLSEVGMAIGRVGVGDRIPARLRNAQSPRGRATVLVGDAGMSDAEASPVGAALASTAAPLLLIDPFQTGSASVGREVAKAGRRAERYYHVFNRSDDANRVQDIITAAAYLRRNASVGSVRLVGVGRAGLWALLAAAVDPGIDAVVADLDGFDATNDLSYVEGLYIPGLRRAGDFRAAAVLLAERADVLLHNAHPSFPVEWFQAAYEAAGRRDSLSVQTEPLSDEDLRRWINS